MALMVAGLHWDFVLAMIIVFREEGDLRWTTLQRRLWLNTPRDPKSGKTPPLSLVVVIPLCLLHIAASGTVLAPIDGLVSATFPFPFRAKGSDLVVS